MDEQATAGSDEELRQRALGRLRKKAEFRSHLTSYVLVNVALVVIWALTSGAGSYFWPIWPILGWGVAFLPVGGHAMCGHGRRHRHGRHRALPE